MALTHVIALFPHLNNLQNYESIRRANVKAVDEKTKALVGDGGFRPSVSRQSSRSVDQIKEEVLSEPGLMVGRFGIGT